MKLGGLRPQIAVQGKTLSISLPTSEPVRIRVLDTQGKTVAHSTATGDTRISLAKIPAGLFFVEARGAGAVNTTPILLD